MLLGHYAAALAAKRAARAAVVIGACVLSHWLLDALAHPPDLPLGLSGGSPKVGLGLWHSLPATALVEGALLAGGLALYSRGRRLPAAFAAALSLLFAGALLAPPPSAARTVALFALGQWLFVFWAWRLERG